MLLYTPEMLHAKVVIFDDRLAVIGSANMDMRSLFLNYEVSLFVWSPAEVERVADWARGLMAHTQARPPARRPGRASSLKTSSASCRRSSDAPATRSLTMPGTESLWYKDAIFYEVYVRGFLRRQRRRRRRLDRPDVEARLPPGTGHRLPLADAHLCLAPEGRRLRHRRFPPDPPHDRHRRRLRGPDQGRPCPRHPDHRRPRRSTTRPTSIPGSRRPAAIRNSPRRNYYVWSDTDQVYKGTRIIFRDTETSNWTWDPLARQYYWHRFFSHQPDLNYDNPAVHQRDARHHGVLARPRHRRVPGRCRPLPVSNARGPTAKTFPRRTISSRRCGEFVDTHYPGTLLLAEANQWPSDLLPYFGNGDEFHMAFNFPLMPRLFMAIRREDSRPIIEIMNQMPEIPLSCQWALFLRNHDELTLEMVTDEERDYMYTEYAKDPRMRINLGIRRRLAPLMDNGRTQIELMHSLLFTLPGSPVLYYGDEIGMGDNIHLGDRNGVRTPMQWSGDRNAGFSRAEPSALYQPVILDPIYNYQGGQRRGPAPVADLAAPLAPADDPGPSRAQGFRPRQPRVSRVRQSAGRRLRQAAPG